MKKFYYIIEIFFKNKNTRLRKILPESVFGIFLKINKEYFYQINTSKNYILFIFKLRCIKNNYV